MESNSSISQQIIELFNAFARSLATNDLMKVRQCYHLPCTLSSPDNVLLLAKEDDFITTYQAIFQQLKKDKFNSFKMLNCSYQHITTALFLINIDWQFFSENEQLITEFTAIYHLAEINGQLKIINVLSQDISQSLALSQRLTFKA